MDPTEWSKPMDSFRLGEFILTLQVQLKNSKHKQLDQRVPIGDEY